MTYIPPTLSQELQLTDAEKKILSETTSYAKRARSLTQLQNLLVPALPLGLILTYLLPLAGLKAPSESIIAGALILSAGAAVNAWLLDRTVRQFGKSRELSEQIVVTRSTEQAMEILKFLKGFTAPGGAVPGDAKLPSSLENLPN